MAVARENLPYHMELLSRRQEVSVILLDETEAGLDSDSQRMMGEIERELLRERGRYIIFKISHNDGVNDGEYNRVVEMAR